MPKRYLKLNPRQEAALLLALHDPFHAYYGTSSQPIHSATARSLELAGLAQRRVELGGKLHLTEEGRAEAEKIQERHSDDVVDGRGYEDASLTTELVPWRPAQPPLRLLIALRLRAKVERQMHPAYRPVLVAGYCARCQKPVTVRMLLFEVPRTEVKVCGFKCANKMRIARQRRRAASEARWERLASSHPDPLRRLIALVLLCADGMSVDRAIVALHGCAGKRQYGPRRADDWARAQNEAEADNGRLAPYKCVLCSRYHVGHVREGQGRYDGVLDELWVKVATAQRASQFRQLLNDVRLRPSYKRLETIFHQLSS